MLRFSRSRVADTIRESESAGGDSKCVAVECGVELASLTTFFAAHHTRGKVVLDLGFIAGRFIISRFEQLILAINQRLAYSLLDGRVVQFALAGRLAGNYLDDAVPL